MCNKVKCINCNWEGEEEELVLIEFDANDTRETPTATEQANGKVQRILPQPIKRDFLKGCPTCLTDGYLTDIN